MRSDWPQIYLDPDGEDVAVFQLRPDNYSLAQGWAGCEWVRMESGGLFLYKNGTIVGKWELGWFLIKDANPLPYILSADSFNNTYLPKYPED